MIEWLFKKYTPDSLISNEYVVFETTRHWINFFNWPLLIGLFISTLFTHFWFIFIGLLILNLLHLYIVIKTDECVVTTKKVVFKSGFLSTNSLEMNLTKIESLSVEQSLLGTILGYGTIIIRGTGGTVETFPKINKPLEIRKKIQEYSF